MAINTLQSQQLEEGPFWLLRTALVSKPKRTRVRICVLDGKRRLDRKKTKPSAERRSHPGADGFQRPTRRLSREYRRPTSKPHHTHMPVYCFLLLTHIPPLPASNKTHSESETQRIEREKVSTFYVF